ncbi:MAG: phenylalanine--tRNA ligase subunit beta [Candidatus Cohnella colombiensis]|uniref:Phenylalanine--tRNA ligase beta subunit n=1 Tax=Candidatus Cohnella colombiensis TaxID=3121368 RepID=A0AA95EY80_9BACL|nr:MAG: phenylalanine--tRNA ligase subunit beta [Cohnella sp.]
MNVSYRWLSDYIDLSGITPQQLAEMMTRGGIEIDSVPSRNAGVSGVVVGYVKEREKHPDADKLSVCKIDVGSGEELQIVCGAPNVAAGQKVPVAMIGAKLPGDFQIKRAKLRGVESQGMICSARELGINDKLLPKEQQEGILVLPADVELGRDIMDVLALDDSILELDLTPNRSDCLSMLGVAYEVAALTGRPLKLPDPSKDIYATSENIKDKVSVTIGARDLCSLYTARYIKGVKVGAAPQWIQNRLIAAGIRPINNIVDITNYVMLEYGQPLHAFDASKITGGCIEIRRAQAGEVLVTLDDQERKLEPHMLVIADTEKAIGLAGVMGGANSEVSSETTDIVLESAKFDGGTVRRTSRQLGLRSEASARFEKEVDAARVREALDRAASLIARYSEGLVLEGIAEAEVSVPEPVKVSLSLGRINGMLGTSLSKLEVKTILSRLQFDAELDGEDRWNVSIPSRRGDITRDVDLVEEVARLNGYDAIPTTMIEGEATIGALTEAQTIRRELRSILTGGGLQEAISYSVTSLERTQLFPALTGQMKPIGLAMPMSEERSVLRTVLLPSLLEAAAYNLSRKNNDLALFEIGNVYHSDEAVLTRLPQEKPRVALLLTGNRRLAGWNRTAQPVDFYDAKGIVETLFGRLGLNGRVSYAASQPDGFHPGRTAAITLETGRGSETIGYVGQLHPELQNQFDLPDTYIAEIELAPIYEYTDRSIEYRVLPRYPAMERDIAVVVDRNVTGGSLTESIEQTAGELLESVKVFDVYTGDRIGSEKKSVALALVYRHSERTLTDEEVTEAHANVLAELEKSFGAELRK